MDTSSTIRESHIDINDLPPELLVHTFSYCLTVAEDVLSQLNALCLVCKNWREWVMNSSSLWREISVRLPIVMNERVLERNPAGKLSVKCDFIRAKNTKRRAFLELATEHAERWDRLLFTGPMDPTFFALLSTPAPRLTALQVMHADSWPYSVCFQLGEVYDVGLYDLELDRFGIADWHSSRLRTLRKLSLRNMGNFLPTSNQFYELLSGTQELEELCIRTSWGAPPSDEASRPWTPITLQRLNHLHLDVMQGNVGDLFLSVIIAPQCRRLYLRGVSVSGFCQAVGLHSALSNQLDGFALKVQKHTFSTSVSLQSMSGKQSENVTLVLKGNSVWRDLTAVTDAIQLKGKLAVTLGYGTSVLPAEHEFPWADAVDARVRSVLALATCLKLDDVGWLTLLQNPRLSSGSATQHLVGPNIEVLSLAGLDNSAFTPLMNFLALGRGVLRRLKEVHLSPQQYYKKWDPYPPHQKEAIFRLYRVDDDPSSPSVVFKRVS